MGIHEYVSEVDNNLKRTSPMSAKPVILET